MTKRAILAYPFVLLCAVLISNALTGPAVAASKSLPPAVRLVLVKTRAMLNKKEVPGAIETLLAFQAKGGPVSDTGRPDTKGYHHPEIYYCLGNCYMLQKEYQRAVAAYEQCVTRDQEHAFAWLNLAKANYEMSRYSEAGRCFERGYEAGAKRKPEHLYHSAVSYSMAGDHRRSIAHFDRLMADHPEAMKAEWKENLVHALMAADLQRRALPYIRELAEHYTGDKQIRWQEILLYQYVKLDMRTEALAYARMLTDRTPTIAKWWKALSHIQLNENQLEDALAALTVYSFLSPLSRDEKKLMADLNLQVGIPVNAAPFYEDCLREKPDNKLIQRLALAYRQLGRPDQALEKLESYRKNREDADLMLLKGELHYLLKQYEMAAAAYRVAAGIKGKHTGRAWLMAGYAAWQMDNIQASRRAFAKACEHDRQKKAAYAALKQLARLSEHHSQKGKDLNHDKGS